MNLFNWPESQYVAFFFVLVRVSTIVFLMPILGDRAVPAVVKIFFSLSLSIVIFPMLQAANTQVPASVMASSEKLVWGVCCEFIFGAIFGLVSRWIFDAVQFAGHFIGTTVGFSMASVFDPSTEHQTLAIAELQYAIAVLIFLALDGHHLLLSSMIDSFKTVKLGAPDLLTHASGITDYLILMTSEVIRLGVRLAAPVIAVVFILNLAFGLLSRAVPQLNALTVSFAVNICVGLTVVLVTTPGFMNLVSTAFDSYMPEFNRFLALFGS